MTSVMDSRQSPLRGVDGALLEKVVQTMPEVPTAVCPPSPCGVPDESRIGGEREFPPSSGMQIPIDLLGDTAIES
jgi:hypothetical protein